MPHITTKLKLAHQILFERLNIWVTLLIPASIVVFGSVATVLQVILNIRGLFGAIQNNLFLAFLRKPSPARDISALILFYFFIEALSPILFPNTLAGLKALVTEQNFILFLPGLVWLCQKHDQDLLYIFVRGARIGAILAGLFALYHFFQFGLAIRPQGIFSVNSIIYGDLALLLSCMSVLFYHRENRRNQMTCIAAIILGLVAVGLSQTRGAWIAVPLLAILICHYLSCRYHLSIKKQVGAGVIIMTAIASTLLIPAIQKRLVAAVNTVIYYDNQEERESSTADRIALYINGAALFSQAPVLGHGTQNRMIILKEQTDYESIYRFSHYHNEYLTNLVGKGLIGLLSLLGLLLGPLYLTLVKYRKISSLETKYFVVILVIGYMQFGLTNLIFGHDLMNTFYTFALTILAYTLNAEQKNSPAKDI